MNLSEPYEVMHPKMKQRRDMLRAQGRCINGPVVGDTSKRGVAHGPVVSGGKCERCMVVHRGSNKTAGL
jgi:hypothetical protein